MYLSKVLIGHVWKYIPGLLHSGLFHKMNQDNYVCPTLTPNIMNEHDYDMNYAYDMSTNVIMIKA